jgi:hypothetical protein
MTHTTTDAAEARAREVLARAMASKHWGSLVREGKDDNWGVIKPSEAIRAMIAFATAEAASGAGEAAAFKRGAEAMQRALADALRDHLNSRAAAIANGIEIPEYRP